MKETALQRKSKAFAVRIIKMYQYLCEEKKEYVLSKQVLRSGTSIGANTHEGFYAQSRADFISKLSVALKESSETSYWLTILYKTDIINGEMFHSLKKDVDEIIRIIISTVKTAKKNAE